MRTFNSLVLLAGVASLAVLAGCTVKDVDTPALAGPSTLARQITLVADRDTLTQNGTDFTDIRITAFGPDGQAENIPLRAQILVDGRQEDFGTLSSKFPITPTTIRYTAPNGTATSPAQSVTIEVTPFNNGDFQAELSRRITIRLAPQGIILPTNPNLVAAFAFTPTAPRVLDTVTFNAQTTTNNGTACGTQCTYVWNFGDGSSGAGVVTTHQYNAVNTFPVTLTVTDVRGAQATTIIPVPVGAGAPPTPVFTTSPESPKPGNTVFLNASESKAAAGRVLVDYFWDFGDGTTASGVSVSHVYPNAGTYTVTLKVTDDARTFAVISKTVEVAP